MRKFRSLIEDLRKWFDSDHPEGGWKRINSKGEAIGPCAREPGEPKPKCMSNEKRAALSKKERAAAVRSKRKHDPNPERKGEPINVSNFGKGKLSEEMEQLDEKNEPTNPELWSRAKSLARSKFDVYPSAYANGWAAKWYKSKGGGWRTVSEETINEDETPPIHVRSLYTQTYAKHGGTIQSAKTASEKAYAAVEKKHGTEMRDKLQAFHARNMNEETDTTEKVEMVQSQLHFIKYACEEILDYIEEGGEVEEWYQVKVAKSFSEFESLHAFIEGESRRTGMKEAKENVHDAIKKIRKEEVEQINELSSDTLRSYSDKSDSQASALRKHAETGEYKDIAKNLLKKREAGMKRAQNTLANRRWTADVNKWNYYEEVEQNSEILDESMSNDDKSSIALKGLTAKQNLKRSEGKVKSSDFLKKMKDRVKAAEDLKKEETKPPFEGGKPRKGVVTDKSGAKHGTMSKVRDIARQAMKKQVEKMKPVKESLDESRKSEIIKGAVKSAKDKKAESKGKEKFESDPVLSSEIMKETK